MAVEIGRIVDGNAPLLLDVQRLVATRLLVQGRSGGGKSWTLRRILEQTHGSIQHLVLDPEGEFASLRERYDYVLAGKGGDIAADPSTAALLAHRLLELRVSAVLDLYELKAGDRRRFVRLFLDALVNAPKSLWHPALVMLDESHMFCLDAETEILAESGWLRWDRIRTGTRVGCFDLADGTCRYDQVQRVIAWQHDGPMVHLKSDGLDSLTTPDHRVVLRREQRAKGRRKVVYPWAFVPANQVPQQVAIPLGGPLLGPGLAELSPEMASLLGWVITEGYWQDAKRGYIGIEQGLGTIKGGVSTVRLLDDLLGGMACRGRYVRKERTHASFGRRITSRASVTYYLGIRLSRAVSAWLGEEIHRVPRRIMEQGSREQLQALWLSLLYGDGSYRKRGWSRFYAGNSEALADDFQELCVRLGLSATKHRCRTTKQWSILISERKWHYSRKPSSTRYRGIVWDVTVPSGAFIARRRGKVFVTGNCPEKGEAESAGAVIELCQRGRKRGFACLLATQRLANLSKQAAAQCANVMVGPTFMDIDRKRACEVLGAAGDRKLLGDLMALRPGQFWCVGDAFDPGALSLVRIGAVRTHHPEIAGGKAVQPGPPPAPEKVKAVLSKLADLPREVADEANERDALRHKAAELQREVIRLEREVAAARQGDRSGMDLDAFQRREMAWQQRVDQALAALAALRDAIKDVPDHLLAASRAFTQAPKQFPRIEAPKLPGWVIEEQGRCRDRVASPPGSGAGRRTLGRPDRPAPAVPSPAISRHSAPLSSMPSGDHDLCAGERRMLEALWRSYPATLLLSQWGTLSAYSIKSSTFKVYARALKRKGFIALDGRQVEITEAGRDLFPAVAIPLSPGETLERWRRALVDGERKMLDALVEAGRSGLSISELGQQIGRSLSSSTFKVYLRKLKRNGLVEESGGILRASDTLFLGAGE